jgi:hypothetical protein
MFFIKPKFGKFVSKTDKVDVDGGRVRYTTITKEGLEMTHDDALSDVSISEMKGISVKEWRAKKATTTPPLKK